MTEIALLMQTEPQKDSHEFTQIRALHENYSRLLARIAVMERELARANQELRNKVTELDRERANLDAVLSSMPTGVVFADNDRRIVRVNDKAAETLGLSPEVLVGQKLEDVRSASGSELLSERVGERDCEVNDGTVRTLARTRSVVRNKSGAKLGTVDLVEDRTERRRIEKQMAHREKLASIGEMSATVAHEVRNPLHAIEGFASLLLRALPANTENEKPRNYAGHIVAGVRNLNALVTNLLEFSRCDRVQTRKCDLIALVQRASDLVLTAHGPVKAQTYTISLEGPQVLMAEMDEIQMSQAVRNLIHNATEAMPDGGRILIKITEEQSGIAIRVCDEGPGVRPDVRHRIFQPFFTTKSRGTGLGLAVVAKAATLHGGRVYLDPSERGAVFTLWFPQHN